MMIRSKIKFLTLIFTAVVLNSCSGTGKIKNLIDFTPKLQTETSAYQVSLGVPAPAREWNEGVNWVNTQPGNFAFGSIPNKFHKQKTSYKRIIAAPVMVGDKIFILSDNATLSAIDSNSYKTLWSNNLNTKSDSTHFSEGGLLVASGRIFATYATREIVALDASDGRKLWSHTLPDLAKTQPVLHGNLLLIVTVSNQLCALDAATGQLIWQHEGLPEMLSYGRGASPIVHQGMVLACYSSGEFVILDVSNGQELWQINVARDDEGAPGFSAPGPESQPIIDGDNVYIASNSNTLMKLNITTGQVYWKRTLADIQSMNKSGNTLFITTNAKQVAALNEATGLVIWANDLSVENAKGKRSYKPVQFMTPVVLDGKLIIVSSDGKMRILSPSTGAIDKVISIDKDASFLVISDSLRLFTKAGILK